MVYQSGCQAVGHKAKRGHGSYQNSALFTSATMRIIFKKNEKPKTNQKIFYKEINKS